MSMWEELRLYPSVWVDDAFREVLSDHTWPFGGWGDELLRLVRVRAIKEGGRFAALAKGAKG